MFLTSTGIGAEDAMLSDVEVVGRKGGMTVV